MIVNPQKEKERGGFAAAAYRKVAADYPWTLAGAEARALAEALEGSR